MTAVADMGRPPERKDKTPVWDVYVY
jgi:hypothetical protein